jgi:hypothetical protein
VGAVGYQSLVVVPSLRQEAQSLQPAPSYFLSVSRGEVPVVVASEHERLVVLTLSRSSDRSFPFYLCEVRDASDRVVLSSVVPAAPQGEELQLVLPTRHLTPGAHVLAVTGLESPSASAQAEPARYAFILQHETGRELR